MQFPDLLPILQVAIGPVILISGVGLLLLTMTNRFGRIIDRTRQLSRELRSVQSREPDRALAQLEILLTRARIVRGAIAAAAVSVLLAAVLIIVIFVSALFRLSFAAPVVGLFASCLASLIGSLVLFLRDVNLSLKALRLEVSLTGFRGHAQTWGKGVHDAGEACAVPTGGSVEDGRTGAIPTDAEGAGEGG